MEISKSTFDSLLEYVNDAATVDKYEFEFVLSSGKITKDSFNRIMTYLYKSDSFKLVDTDSRETLDVRSVNDDTINNVRMSIVNKNSILEHCKSGAINTKDVVFVNKHSEREKRPIMLDDYHVRANLKVEEPFDSSFETADYLKKLRVANKTYRYKKRYSFVHTTKTHRVDMSVVRSSTKGAKSMVKSGVLHEPEHYEVEVEYMNDYGSDKNPPKKEIVLRSLLKSVYMLCKLNANVSYLLPQSKKLSIVKEYASLVEPKLANVKDSSQFVKNPSEYYLKYQPVTLMKRNLLTPDVDVVSIRENYCVTDKADGERFILYIGSDRKLYLINNLLDVTYTGISHKTSSKTIIDGEYIRRGKLNIDVNMFAAFDLYFSDGKDVRTLPLVTVDGQKKSGNTRLSKLEAILSSESLIVDKSSSARTQTSQLRVVVKTFEVGSNIFDLSKKVLDRLPTLSYNTDGLIYTPTDLSPGALYKNDTTMKPFGGSWSKVFKWKPPEDNSIDVLVKLGKVATIEVEPGLMQRCVYIKMYVAFKGSLDETVDVSQVYTKISKMMNNTTTRPFASPTKNDQYVHRLYDGTYLPVDSNDSSPYIGSTTEKIQNDTIVEFSYNPNSTSEYMKWVPLRVRKDKTDLYLRNNRRIENTANNYFTVVNVWRTITDPVTSNVLSGSEPLDEELVKKDDSDVYYARNTPRDRSLLVPMLNFHNYWVKNNTLLNLFKGKRMKLLDIGCGQGGDIPKWIDADFSTVVGIDNNEDNLLNSDKGIYRRYFDNVNSVNANGTRRIDPEKQRMLFLLMDGGKKWTSSYIDNISSMQFKQLTRLAFGMDNKRNQTNPMLQSLHDVMNEGFDVVSCQFAIHYFFQSAETLDAFCFNIDKMLLPNGYFVGTALDGNIVNDKFVKNDTTVLRGDVNGKVLWQIEKSYDGFADVSSDEENIGKEVQVYVETINKRIPEYLVDFELLKRKLAKYNIRLVDFATEENIFIEYDRPTSSFEYLYDKMRDAYTSGKRRHHFVKTALENMDDVMKEYSFMNRWFVFKKYI